MQLQLEDLPSATGCCCSLYQDLGKRTGKVFRHMQTHASQAADKSLCVHYFLYQRGHRLL